MRFLNRRRAVKYAEEIAAGAQNEPTAVRAAGRRGEKTRIRYDAQASKMTGQKEKKLRIIRNNKIKKQNQFSPPFLWE
jgi:hypothetical protein